ncbi:uncharacterized membrane protein HdeD (DUF308 family) [Dysgonomonas sp. PH5-45]|uniref:HdeD family acid-resistance protein n=1 Tax=unclassified Dysgonomonas TaxID=2630389 RepID=UPI0024761382|nr:MULTISPECIES: DUF308 domain-containing protein [unclassified Dysgonomonas]MDH6353704.1 uncharacterized membrane protein HdeD (DUF308 family) [Dysgonomonas sp. PH5-45]MDH6386607.1 uncharacterized membrane protein HdeD (DUF308 family) [Dysgonomonas sp. PH5-37]
MEREVMYKLRKAVKYWWISLIIGLLAIGLGIWCIASPMSTLIALSIVFAISFLVTGAMEISFAVANRDNINGWGWSLTSGIIDLLFGVFLIVMPIEVITTIFALFIGIWIMFRSIWGVGMAIDLQKFGAKGWGWLLTLAILGILVSFIFIMDPPFAMSFIVAFASVGFIFYGLFRVFLAIKLKSLHRL